MLAFAAHVALRGRYPRQLPPLTPLGVREIYAGIALAWAVENASSAYTRRMMYDAELRTVELNALILRRSLLERHPRTSFLTDLANHTENTLSSIRKWREVAYHDLDVLGKIWWWHNHMWSDTAACGYVAHHNPPS
ncbi:hypothetical protein C8Q79DRAFT_161517 [Trametes meyenii]|nr:hypothetical protein C8Q79DRAFT_161517 [Trametes meyenii]